MNDSVHASGGSLFRNLLFRLNMGASLYRSGYRYVYDLDNVEATIGELLKVEQPEVTFAQETLESRNNHLWHYLERTVRKYRRGEYYLARSRIHGLVRDYVYPLIELRESRSHPEKNVYNQHGFGFGYGNTMRLKSMILANLNEAI